MGFLSRRKKIMLNSSPEKLTGQICPQIFTELKVRGDFERLPLHLLFSMFSASLITIIFLVGRRRQKQELEEKPEGMQGRDPVAPSVCKSFSNIQRTLEKYGKVSQTKSFPFLFLIIKREVLSAIICPTLPHPLQNLCAYTNTHTHTHTQLKSNTSCSL
jgi:hypothetical protein